LGMLNLEEELDRTVSSIANKIISVASSVASAGKFFAREFEKAALDPIAEKITEYDKQLADLERFLGQEQESGNAIQQEYNRLLAERNKLEEEYEETAKGIAEFENQQSRLQFLQQQVSLIRSIQDSGLDPAEILEGLNLGLDATLPELIEATSRFIGAMVDEANEILEIHSPSKVFKRIGEQSVAGFIEALKHAKTDVAKVTGQAIGGAIRPNLTTPNLAAMSALAPATGIYTTNEGNKALHIYGDVRLERVDSGEDLIERLLELD
jgi:archaellum component FlaC